MQSCTGTVWGGCGLGSGWKDDQQQAGESANPKHRDAVLGKKWGLGQGQVVISVKGWLADSKGHSSLKNHGPALLQEKDLLQTLQQS
jgi:hypothetical protein